MIQTRKHRQTGKVMKNHEKYAINENKNRESLYFCPYI